MFLLIICLLAVPFIVGSWSLRLHKNKEDFYLVEIYMTGLLFLFGLYEIIGCLVIRTDASFARYCNYVILATTVITVLSAIVNFRLIQSARKKCKGIWILQKTWLKKKKRVEYLALMVAMVLLIALQIIAIFHFVPDTAGDTTVETIYATISSEKIYTHNPLTGEEMVNGIFPLHKLTSLPILYAALTKIFGVSVPVLTFVILPIGVLLLNLFVLSGLGLSFFHQAKEDKNIFLLIYEVTVITGCLASGTYSDNLLFGGWKGLEVTEALILPFIFLILYRMIKEKEYLYGGVGLLFGVVGIIFTRPMFPPQITGYITEKILSRFGLLLVAVIGYYLVMERTKKKWKPGEILVVAICLLLGFFPETAAAAIGISVIGALLYRIALQRGRGKRALAGFLLLSCLAGTVIPFGGVAVMKESLDKGDVEAVEAIGELAKENGQIVLLAPDKVMERARLNSPRVHLVYGKDLWIEKCNREVADLYSDELVFLHEQMKTDYLQSNAIAAMAKDTDCNVLVLREKMEDNIAIQYGYRLWKEVTDYAIYTCFSTR